jgi:uncharacterized protein
MNRLAGEISPYLLQHAGNPVDWQPWGEEAFARARAEQKPVFLSIGYSACHWCHVMAHESFEDPYIAGLLDENFVSIKVDREERPDLDQIYMEAVQAMTGNGGWPLSAFLTPDGEPLFGGTYWPPRRRGGMPGFDDVLRAVREAWCDRREQVVQQAKRITAFLRAEEHETAEVDELTDAPLQAAEKALPAMFDPRNGGFGAAPKFPQATALRLLLQRGTRGTVPFSARRFADHRRPTLDVGARTVPGPENRDSLQKSAGDILAMVRLTLDRMAAGGIYDQLGGGFHRYSVDAEWLVPHFEKMLYDNAMLAVCYLEAWQATGRAEYARVVRETLDYVLRRMTDAEGGFYSAEDADSEGEEGRCYVWTPAQVEEVLGAERARTFCYVYDVSDAGNFDGQNVLHLARPVALYAKLLGRDAGELEAELAEDRVKLLAARQERLQPAVDDKVLVSWNGLMIEAMALAGAAFDEPRYRAAAATAADFILQSVSDCHGGLAHCWRAGRATQHGFLDDYASLANALATLHETDSDERGQSRFPGGGDARRGRKIGTVPGPHHGPKIGTVPESRWLEEAVRLADTILARFADENGGFFYAPLGDKLLIASKKDLWDNPVPSGTALAVTALLRLAELADRPAYRQAAESTLRKNFHAIEQSPLAAGQSLMALETAISRRAAAPQAV